MTETPTKEKIIFFGRNQGYGITTRCYEQLVGFTTRTGHEIVLTVTTNDHLGQEGTLSDLATKNGLEQTSVEGNNVNNSDFIEKITKYSPTMFLVVQFPKIFSSELTSIPTKAALNVHRGWPLRGGSIDERAIFYQSQSYNVILHHMVDKIDGGSIIGKVGFDLNPDETGYSLVEKTDHAGVSLLEQHFFPYLGEQFPQGEIQDLSQTVYGSKDSLDNKLDFSQSASQLERLVRAFHHPRKSNAWFEQDRPIYILPPIGIKVGNSHQLPGEILDIQNDQVLIATNEDVLVINTIHLGDKIPVSFKEYLENLGYIK